MRFLLILGFLVSLLTVPSTSVFGLGGNHEKGKIDAKSHPEWQAGLVDLINSMDRVGGYWVNQSDFFFYSGDAKSLNKFIVQYSKVPATPLKIVLHTGTKALTGRLGEKHETPFNWELSIVRRGWGEPRDPRLPEKESGYVVTIHVWLSDTITLKELEIPKHVDVSSGNEIEKFIEAHRESRSK
jgi:hypothetical protein